MRGRGCVRWGACIAGGMHAPGHYEIWSVNALAVRILLECILVSSLLINRSMNYLFCYTAIS